LARRLLSAARMNRTLLALLLAACAPQNSNSGSNLFTDGENADTGWQSSLDAQEVEVDLEGDVQADALSMARAPLSIGQFALTYLRRSGEVYLQSLAEDYDHGTDRIEWTTPGHFRIRGLNAVIMHPGDQPLDGRNWQPIVPKSPGTLLADAGDACGEKDGEIDVTQSEYWYVWHPEKDGCKDDWKQTVSVTVSKVLPKGSQTYPEYDRLTADGKIEILALFGQVDHGALSDGDYGFSLVRDFESQLTGAGFTKADSAPRGLRYTRTANNLTAIVDIYTPREFGGLTDWAHIDAFDEGVRTHEIIAYNGHSVLGASDFWARPSIYNTDEQRSKYQIFVYNGCLGYEYYVKPILDGKGGWDNVDLLSNTEETPFAIMVEMTTDVVSMVLGGAENGGRNSWQQIMTKMNSTATGWNSYYGASGIRDNRFMPQ
jgi:hypothetical protein